MLALGLGLSACGDDDDADAADGGGGRRRPTSGSGSTAPTRPHAARDWLKTTFEDEHPGSTLTIEQQEWEGLVEKLTTSLSSDSETPDVVEVGNTQAPTFTAAGAFSDVTDDLDDWGGDDLLPGFVEGATVDGKTYAVPYYAGSKYVFYRKDLFEAAGIAVPTTMDEFVAGRHRPQDRPTPSRPTSPASGSPARTGATASRSSGTPAATSRSRTATSGRATLSAPESVEGLETVQTLMEQASGAAKDGNEDEPADAVLRRRGRHALRARLGQGPDRGPRRPAAPTWSPTLGVFALPGHRRRARAGAARRLRHRDLGQVQEPGPGPGRRRADAQRRLPDDHGRGRPHPGQELAVQRCSATTSSPQATIAAASNAKLTPAAPGWAEVEGSRVLEDLFVDIAKGGDVEELAAAADEQITDQLN